MFANGNKDPRLFKAREHAFFRVLSGGLEVVRTLSLIVAAISWITLYVLDDIFLVVNDLSRLLSLISIMIALLIGLVLSLV